MVTIVQDILDSRQSDVASAGGTAWKTLSSILPDRPGGWAGVKAAGAALLSVKLLRRIAIAAGAMVVALLLLGISFVVMGEGGWRALGAMLILLNLIAVAAVTWTAFTLIGRVRDFVSDRVDAFLGPVRVLLPTTRTSPEPAAHSADPTTGPPSRFGCATIGVRPPGLLPRDGPRRWTRDWPR